MKFQFVKKLALILLISVLAVYIIFLILPFLINPIIKNYSPQISEELKKNTGLNSTIFDLRILTTPKLTVGVAVKDFGLISPDDKNIAKVEDFKVKLSLLPILAKKIEVDVVQAKNLNANIVLKQDGTPLLMDYLPKTENVEEDKEPIILPFGLKLSNHLPDIKIDNYKISFVDSRTSETYVISGHDSAITDFILDKSVHIKSTGDVTFVGKKQFAYNVNIKNYIMPELNLNDLVCNPQEEEKSKKQAEPVNILEILKSIHRYNLTANLNADIKAENVDNKYRFKGFSKIDNLSISPNGLVLPSSDVNLKFNGDKIDINSNLYTAQNERSTVNGFVQTGKKTKTSLNIKSNAELSNLVQIINAIAQTFNINDLQTLKANGRLDANFNIKSDTKKMASSGYLRIPSANVYYGIYDVKIDNINADILLDNNNLNIKNLSFSILNQPLKIFGTINHNALADIKVTSSNLSLRGLLVACGQATLMKENKINSGTVNLNIDVKGKLDSLKPTVKVVLNNLDIKNVPADLTLKLPQTNVDIIAQGEKYSGTIKSASVKVVNPALTVNIPNISANVNNDIIEVLNTPVYVEKIRMNVSGKISNYLREKITVVFKTSGDIKSELKGDINLAKQHLNLLFSAPDNCEIIIPMFDKSKLIFKGSTSISGNLANPMLSGNFDVPVISIPEIPVTLDNMQVKLNGAILNGKASVAHFASGGIKAQNITTDFALKGAEFHLNNMKGNAFDGDFAGNVIYNMSNAKTFVNFKGSKMDAQKAVFGATGIKDALSGTLGFNAKLNLVVLDYDTMVKSLKGNIDFDIANGSFGSLGRLENLFRAGNILGNTLLKSTVATISNIGEVKNSAKFDYIKGELVLANGWAKINYIKSAGSTLAYYINGRYNLLNGTTDVVLLGRLSTKVVSLLGPLGDLSTGKLLSYIPVLGDKTAAIAKALTTNPKQENTSAIPKLTSDTTYKDFKVVYRGGIESAGAVQSFKWLAVSDTTAIEKTDLHQAVKDIKSSFGTDIKSTVNDFKEMNSAVKTDAKAQVESAKESMKNIKETFGNQKDLIKNSVGELKSLFK